MKITELLENFEFPEFSLSDMPSKVDAVTILSILGNYCMRNRIKSKEIVNCCNRSMRFVSSDFGRHVSLEIKSSPFVEVLNVEYSRFSGCYGVASKESYELLCN